MLFVSIAYTASFLTK